MTSSTRGGTYKLSGFPEMLPSCAITFKERLPATKVCKLCGVVPSLVFLLPCSHSVCEFCKTLISKGTPRCPIDGERFKYSDLPKIECSLRDLTERDVRCPNDTGTRVGCAFSGKLRNLSKHLARDCTHAQAQCPQCGEGFPRRAIIAHHSRCEASNSASASTSMRGGTSQRQNGEHCGRPASFERPSDYHLSRPEGSRPLGSERVEQSEGTEREAEVHFSRSEFAERLEVCRPSPMEPGRRMDTTCYANHETKFVHCAKGVVYRIPLTCGYHYVGQTSVCLNERLRQHRCSLGTGRGNLARHCSHCRDCRPLFHLTAVLESSQNESERLRMEAEYIDEDRENCISEFSSAVLHEH
ncbi:uncharacterized protein LOC144107031 isoform X2 [Amblyomma americanum]